MTSIHTAAMDFTKRSAEAMAFLHSDPATMSPDEMITASVTLLGMTLDALRADKAVASDNCGASIQVASA